MANWKESTNQFSLKTDYFFVSKAWEFLFSSKLAREAAPISRICQFPHKKCNTKLKIYRAEDFSYTSIADEQRHIHDLSAWADSALHS